MTFARARSLAVLAGLALWLVAWLARPAGLADPAWTVILGAGTILLLAAAAGWAGAWLYGRVRHTVQLRRYRREQAAAALPAGAPPTGAPPTGAPPTGAPPTGAPPPVAVPAGAVPAGAVPAAGVPAAGVAAATLAAAGPVGCAAVLVTRDSDCPGGMRAVHSGAGRSGRPGLAVTRDTRFEIGSVTKVFTGLILADMVVCGETGLDATLGTLLGLPGRAGGAITLRALATHTSGLPRLVPGWRMTARVLTAHPNPYRGIDLARAASALERHPPAAPGIFRYSNLGYQLLGAALAAAAGHTWPDLVRQRICVPLGLTATGVEPDAGTARGHDQAGLPVPYWDSSALPGAGALVSCAADLEAFVRAQLDPGRTELGEAIRLSRTSHTGGRAIRPVGLGWMLDTTPAGSLAWHNGGTGGFGAVLAVAGQPGQQAGIALLANSVHSAALDVFARQALRSLADR